MKTFKSKISLQEFVVLGTRPLRPGASAVAKACLPCCYVLVAAGHLGFGSREELWTLVYKMPSIELIKEEKEEKKDENNFPRFV